VTRVLVVTAVDLEARGLARHLGLARVDGSEWPHYRGGALELVCAGPRAAHLDARAAGIASIALVVSAGVCGALSPDLAEGDLIVPEAVVAAARRVSTTVLPELRRAGTLVMVDEIVASPEQKARLWVETGALACDMESATILEWAARRGLRGAGGPRAAARDPRGDDADERHEHRPQIRRRRPRQDREGPGMSSPDALVTGATGFVGANVARELLREGATVRVLARPNGDRRAIDGLKVEVCDGDLVDPASLRRAVRGVRSVYHVAADYRLWARRPEEIYRANVEGTRAVLQAAADAGVTRVVHTSSVGALGIPKDGSPGTETTPVALADMVGPYKASKFLAEQVALGFALKGLPVVIVNPSTPIGPWDVKPTPTGQMVVDFLRNKMFATLDTGLNIVHVRDVARGHLLAAERGRVGEKYILGHANLTLAEIGLLLAEIAGSRAPRARIPYAVAWLAAGCMEVAARVTGTPPRASLTAVRMARKRMFFSSAKAIRELGLPQTDVRTALAEAAEWFVEHGYAARARKTA
jgi:dihydroflavonol-4-reductase